MSAYGTRYGRLVYYWQNGELWYRQKVSGEMSQILCGRMSYIAERKVPAHRLDAAMKSGKVPAKRAGS